MELITIQDLAHKLWIHGLHTENKEWAEIELIAYPPKESKETRAIVCKDCGMPCMLEGRAKYCSTCKERRNKENKARSNAKTREIRSKKLSPCKHCGRKFKRGPGQKYCPICVSISEVGSSKRRVFR